MSPVRERITTSRRRISSSAARGGRDRNNATDLVAYRVIQEALTNGRRHTPEAGIVVTVDHAARRLRLTIRDDGHGASGPVGGAGLGLVGMRERVGTVGGTLRHGPHADGGFEIVAELPLEPES